MSINLVKTNGSVQENLIVEIMLFENHGLITIMSYAYNPMI